MAHKQVLFRSAAREKILRGATQLAEAVRTTLGPRSKSMLIQKKWGAPIVCNDGVAIAKENQGESSASRGAGDVMRWGHSPFSPRKKENVPFFDTGATP